MSDRDDLAAKIKDAYYHARDHGGTMHTAADDAADAIVAAGWVSPKDYREVFLRMGHAAATVERVRALCGDNAIYADFGEPPNEYVVPGVMESDLLVAIDEGNAAAESSP